MAALDSMSDYVNTATTAGRSENPWFFKNPFVAGVQDTWEAGRLYSAWTYDGFPGPGSAPGAVAVPTEATAGALPLTDAGGGRTRWLMSAALSTANPSNLMYVVMYDRLLHISGLSGTTITAQTVGGTLTRGLNYVGNQIFVEIYAAVGTTARTITASYTKEDGVTTGRTTTAVVFGGSVPSIGNDDRLMIQLPLQAGDKGVHSVQSVTISATTGTAGNFGVTIARPLAFFPFDVSGTCKRSVADGMPGTPELEVNSCVAFAMFSGSTTEQGFIGAIGTVER